MYRIIIIFSILSSILFCECTSKNKNIKETPSKVELKKTDNKYRLYVNNKPFYIKGAGLEGGDIESLASHGANSFRTWRTDNGKQTAKEVLDEAQKNGLMVLMGIDIGRDRHGYDYDDTEWVRSQYEAVKTQVIEIKNHPALLAWAVGNELNLHNSNKKVWSAINDISRMIHEIDGNHPTTTTFAGFSKENADDFEKYCPDIDFISIQMYGDIINLQERLKNANYNGPYMVTEWGATGHWEMPKTEWGIPIEQTGTEKAKAVRERWERAINIDQENCLGSYIFLWGQKQERTPTWYGLFTENNKEIEVIDVMHEIWTGQKQENSCPSIDTILFDGKNRFENVKLIGGKEIILKTIAHDQDGDSLTMFVEILPDMPENYGDGGDYEDRSEAVIKSEHIPYTDNFKVIIPQTEGAYRIFVYITDNNKKVATANIPFYVVGNNSTKI